jgi:uncharacterized protein YgiM (DUF1202 family)
MKKSSLYTIGGITLVILAGYLLYRKSLSKKATQIGSIQEPIQTLDNNIIEQTTKPSSGLASAFSFLTEYNDYQVDTTSTSLNVREKPDGKSKVIGTLPKNSKIKAKASGVRGWFDVSKDGKTNFGYVSAQFLKALPKSK